MITIKENLHKHYYPEENNGVCVIRRKGESVEDLLKRFRKVFSKSGISREFKEKMYHEKPSDKKRRKRAKAIRALEREEEKLEKKKEKIKKIKQRQQKRLNKWKGKNDDQSC